ncbi:MAG: PglZ domain-containing protein, partial [Bacteroidia bacterium]|nr:PglZ domain-containing protein [Bacteroidia bacterium]
LIVVDNMRYDQWRIIREMLAPFYRIESEDLYYAILPTVTQYARNAIFAGLMPLEIEQLESDLWVGEGDEGAMNGFEHELLQRNIQRCGRSYKTTYYKGANLEGNPLLAGDYSQMLRDDLTVVVYNFVDMLSHARSDMRMVKQLAVDVHGYLSLTQSWFKHSDLFVLLQRLVDQPIKVVITTDHGSIQVKRPTRVIGDRATTPNLRYKMGKNLNYQERDVYDTTRPASLHLPQLNVSSRYIFATGDYFFAYPNNYNQFVNMYRDSFQHGGVSLEEMIVPVVTMKGMR